MGNKVDYRSKNKSKLIKYLKVVGIIVLAVTIGYILIQSIIRAYRTTIVPNNNTTADLHYDVDEYKTLEDILNAHGCVYISELRDSEGIKIYLKFDRDLYTDNVSNERFFDNLIKVIADFENYKTFELIDEEREIDILVTCEENAIVQVQINGDNNYYLNQESKINSRKEKAEVTEISIDSNILQTLINNDWNPIGLNLGTKESTCDGYEIYFDEGFKYKVSGRMVYNLIFTEKYSGKIVSGLGTYSTAEDVEKALGTPTFTNNSTLYGYVGENNYVFFDFMNKQVSVYPVINMENETEFIDLINSMNETSDIKQFSMDLISLWTDYDIYDYDSNYVNLQYTLRGIKLSISSNSLKNGVYIYQNYNGDIDRIKNLDNIYIQSTDLVFDEESKRANNEILKRKVQGDFSDEELSKLGKKFSVYFRGKLASNETGSKGPTFYSRDGEYPDTELESTLVISSYAWYDDYNFVYSVDDDGIYLYNPVSRTNSKIIDISGQVTINSAGDGKIVYNDTEQISISFE